jgi:hypothetical protein
MGGRVHCLDALCPNQIMETFTINQEIFEHLFSNFIAPGESQNAE